MFEVWVLPKEGLVCVNTADRNRPRTIHHAVKSHHLYVRAHLVRGGTLPLGCVRVLGMVWYM